MRLMPVNKHIYEAIESGIEKQKWSSIQPKKREQKWNQYSSELEVEKKKEKRIRKLKSL